MTEYNIDNNYDVTIGMREGYNESLTASLIKFLRYKGLDVRKSTHPVAMCEGSPLEMKSRKLGDGDMRYEFEKIYEYLVECRAKIVLIYMVNETYTFSQDVDVSYRPIGDPTLSIRRYFRYGVIAHEE